MKHPLIIFFATLTFIMCLSNDICIPGVGEIAIAYNTSIDVVIASVSVWFFGLLCTQLFLLFVKINYSINLLLVVAVFFIIINGLLFVVESSDAFILLRFLTGVTVGFLAPITYTIIYQQFPGDQATKYFYKITSICAGSIMLGPIIGSIFISIGLIKSIFIFEAVFSMFALIYFTFTNKQKVVQRKSSHNLSDVVQLLFNFKFITYTLVNSLFFASFIVWIATGVTLFSQEYVIFTLLQVALVFSFVMGSIIGSIYLSQFTLRSTDITVNFIIVILSLLGCFINLISYQDSIFPFFLVLIAIGSIFPIYQKKALDQVNHRLVWPATILTAIINSSIALIASLLAVYVITYSHKYVFIVIFLCVGIASLAKLIAYKKLGSVTKLTK
ncbi:MFS transporter [Shewanella surugensis]|uniref:MFS transporter n=1 Tax=Shewanella surugensis TaxID=212020 RepID=A0ABT0LKX3_9GAMM|nr:MFS transporter [Shewanella surugensis]MCL1127806.1 MFS transporter [Shewanella surugensis]